MYWYYPGRNQRESSWKCIKSEPCEDIEETTGLYSLIFAAWSCDSHKSPALAVPPLNQAAWFLDIARLWFMHVHDDYFFFLLSGVCHLVQYTHSHKKVHPKRSPLIKTLTDLLFPTGFHGNLHLLRLHLQRFILSLANKEKWNKNKKRRKKKKRKGNLKVNVEIDRVEGKAIDSFWSKADLNRRHKLSNSS